MDQIIGQIQQFAFTYAPQDWALCHGQVMRVADNQALYALLGTTYGGDYNNTFNLPDLRPRDENGVLLNLKVGDIYQNKPYMETCIALNGIWPSRP